MQAARWSWPRKRVQLLCCVMLSSCAEHPPVTIEDRSSAAQVTAPEVRRATQIAMADKGELAAGPDYIVQPGDTLYAIAFRLGMDYRALAALNQIEAPYTIFVGQSLATEAPEVVAQSSPESTTEAAARSSGIGDATASSSTASKPPSTVSASPKPPAAAAPKPTAPKTPPPVAKVAKEPTPQPSVAPKPVPVANVPVDRWGWPAKGRISRSYAEDVHKGIDLAGARGDPVRASAAGVVVYAGTGVTGYGALIIVKHNDTYLSAYGHNDELLAREGDQVSAGKLIARMGSSGTDSVKLHFEIRRNGRPINPSTLLTSR